MIRFIFILLLFIETPLWSLENQIDAVFVNNALQEAKPGEVVTVSILISNRNDSGETCLGKLSFPDDWKVFPDAEQTFELEPHEERALIFCLKVSPKAIAGPYEIQFDLTGTAHKVHSQARVVIQVASQTLFSATVEKKTLFIAAGESFDVTVRCNNKGNVAIPIYLEAHSDPEFDIDILDGTLLLEPGESRDVVLTVYTLTGRYPCAENYVFLKIFNSCTEEILLQQAVNFEMISRGKILEDPYIRIPCHASFITAKEWENTIFAFEYAGGGLIDFERERYLNFFFRIPTESKNNAYEVYQRFYIDVNEPDWDVYLGDTWYDLSTLTENRRYARGLGVDIIENDVQAGAFYARDLFNQTDRESELGAYIAYDWTECSNVSLNFLNKRYHKTPRANILSIATEWHPNNQTLINVELARNVISRTRNKGRNAYHTEMSGRLMDNIWYYLENDYAGSAFYGYYHNMNLLSGSLNYQISCPLRASLSFNFYKQNLRCHDDLQIYNSQLKQRQFNGQVNYSFVNGATVALTAYQLRAKDEKSSCPYNFNQHWGGLNLNWSCPDFNIYTQASIGQLTDYLTHKKNRWLQKYYLFLTWNATSRSTLYFLHESGHTNYYDIRHWNTVFGGGYNYRIGCLTWCNLFFHTTSNIPAHIRQNQFSASFAHTFRNGHSAVGNFQYFHCTHNSASTQYRFLIAYTIPLNMPVARRTDIGSVWGRVYDETTQTPVENAVVNLDGMRLLTAADGSFEFQGMQPGEHMFKTDRLPGNLISTKNEPVMIEIPHGRTVTQPVSVASMCKICGKVVLYNRKGDPEDIFRVLQEPEASAMDTQPIIEQGGLGGILLTLENQDDFEVKTYLSNSKGEFNFENLRPGKWTLRATADQLPAWHYIDPVETGIVLNPGGENKINIRIMPKKPRQLKKLD